MRRTGMTSCAPCSGTTRSTVGEARTRSSATWASTTSTVRTEPSRRGGHRCTGRSEWARGAHRGHDGRRTRRSRAAPARSFATVKERTDGPVGRIAPRCWGCGGRSPGCHVVELSRIVERWGRVRSAVRRAGLRHPPLPGRRTGGRVGGRRARRPAQEHGLAAALHAAGARCRRAGRSGERVPHRRDDVRHHVGRPTRPQPDLRSPDRTSSSSSTRWRRWPGCRSSTSATSCTSTRSPPTTRCRSATGRASGSPPTWSRPGWCCWPTCRTPSWTRYLDRPLEASTDHTITDPAALRQRLAAIAADGYVWTRDEYVPGISSVAAPIFGFDGSRRRRRPRPRSVVPVPGARSRR